MRRAACCAALLTLLLAAAPAAAQERAPARRGATAPPAHVEARPRRLPRSLPAHPARDEVVPAPAGSAPAAGPAAVVG